jgi:soluble lytic murein transglycosylase
MNPIKKIVGLSLILIISACQSLPIPIPINLPTANPTIPPDAPGTIPSPTPFPPGAETPPPASPPILRIESGDTALFNGDYELARQQYQSAFNDTTDNAVKAAALWGLGRTELADEQYQFAIDRLTNLINEYPDSTYAARAYFLMGQAYYQLKQYQASADAYTAYLTRVPGVLDAYVQEYRGDALSELKDYTGALNAYDAALAASRLDDGLLLQIKRAQTRAVFGDHAGALTLYDQIFATTTNDYIKAQMDYLAGLSYIALGQIDKAHERYLHTVQNYPLSYYSYLALVDLVDAGIQVDDFERGLIDYYAEQFDVALVAFERYIAANPTNSGSVHYFRALTFREMQRTAEAVQELDYFIKAFPDNPNWVDAWNEKAFLQWSVLGDYNAAAQTMLEYVALASEASNAPEFLLAAGRIYERDNQLDLAAQTWERVANEYPGNEQSSLGLFWAGITRYRQNDYAGALALFNRSLLLASRPEDQSRAQFWIGKTQTQLGDRAAAQQAWQQGQAIDKTEYYSQRSRDMLLGRGFFESPSLVNLEPDLSRERQEAEAWVRITFNLPPETDLTGPGAVAQDARFIRGTELWELGMYGEAREEFESLRESLSTSPADTFRLGNHLLGIGLYRSAIFAMRQVLTLAGLDSQAASLEAPPYFNHIRYGLYYRDLILYEEQNYGLDPLFMFSVIRQESLFEGFVNSTAGARGLMQVVPPTGEQIAGELGWPDRYDANDLYRPNVSVRFGSYYMAKNRDEFGGNMYAALAAYNGGPGNAAIWNSYANNDPDLLAEIIRFEETRNYIRLIYEIYGTYRMIYSPEP